MTNFKQAEEMVRPESLSFPEEPENEIEEQPLHSIQKDQKGTYRWIYELPMAKSFFLLFEVWKVLGLSALIIMIMVTVFDLLGGNGLDAARGGIQVAFIVLGIMLVLSVPAYAIVTRANNGKYTVLFEMDEEGVDHTQIKTEKAWALELLTMFVGGAAKNRTTTAAGLLSAAGGSLYSRFDRVRRIRAVPDKNVIFLNGMFVRNQVYVDSEDFDFVYDYIRSRCVNAVEVK